MEHKKVYYHRFLSMFGDLAMLQSTAAGENKELGHMEPLYKANQLIGRA